MVFCIEYGICIRVLGISSLLRGNPREQDFVLFQASAQLAFE